MVCMSPVYAGRQERSNAIERGSQLRHVQVVVEAIDERRVPVVSCNGYVSVLDAKEARGR